MMKSPLKIARTFKKLSAKLKVPVTGKIRLGWDRNKNYKLIARIVEECGGSLIAIHGRTKEQSLQRQRQLGRHRRGKSRGQDSRHRQWRRETAWKTSKK